MILPPGFGPGNVVVCDGDSAIAKWIEVAAVLRGKPAANHVALFHHTDQHGTHWGIEGRPGGVGWVDLRRYLTDRRTRTNAAQPLTAAQRAAITTYMVKLLGSAYDWLGGIAADGAQVLNIPVDWSPDPKTGLVPGHVVCSSSTAWAYQQEGVPAPTDSSGAWRHVTPGDWSGFIQEQGWLAAR